MGKTSKTAVSRPIAYYLQTETERKKIIYDDSHRTLLLLSKNCILYVDCFDLVYDSRNTWLTLIIIPFKNLA